MGHHAGAGDPPGQMVIDNGSWENSALLLPVDDPLHQEKFAGEATEMRSVFKYRRALLELEQQMAQLSTQKVGEEEDAGAGPKARK